MKTVVVQIERGCLAAAHLPRGVSLMVVDLDQPEEDDGTYCRGCVICRDPHRHWTQDKSDWNGRARK